MGRKTQTNLLGKKGEFTKFQILLEVIRNQPHVKQKDISFFGIGAGALEHMTPKAAH